METPARTPLHQTTRALRLSALLRIQRSTSWREITGSENSSIAPFRDRFRTRQSMVEDRPLNTIRPARYVRRLSLLRCSFILRSLFGTARGFYLWFSNGRTNLNLLTTLRTAFHDERFTPRPASHVRSSLPLIPQERRYSGHCGTSHLCHEETRPIYVSASNFRPALSTSRLIRRWPMAAPGVQIPPRTSAASRRRQIAHSEIIFEVDP